MDKVSKRILVLGAGESGCGAALLAKAKHHTVFVSDNGNPPAQYSTLLNQNKIPFETDGHHKVYTEEWDLVVKSPGLPPEAPVLKTLGKREIPIISEIEFAFRYCQGKIIAITGTNGKTTTSSLIYEILKSANYKVELCGNIGRSFAATLVQEPPPDYYVLEVSSFQLENIVNFKPDIAILLNITPDHLDYHGNFETYRRTKFKLFKNMTSTDYIFYNSEVKTIEKYIENVQANWRPLSFIYYFNSLQINWSDKIYEFKHFSLQGSHNAFNMTAAACVALHLKIDKSSIQTTLTQFKSLPHRMEFVRNLKGILFINDSKATNIESTLYALQTYPRVIWIVGGIDKGNDYQKLRTSITRNVSLIICLGKDNQKLKLKLDFFKGSIKDTHNIKDAVNEAYKAAKTGDVVLLSPACSSFDLFKNYQERGNLFRDCVLELPDY